MNNIKKEITELLSAVLESKISAREAIEKWPKDSFRIGRKIDAAYHELWHFYQDEDIRKKDEEYAKHQVQKLRKIIDGLLM